VPDTVTTETALGGRHVGDDGHRGRFTAWSSHLQREKCLQFRVDEITFSMNETDTVSFF
jgi:hypothetical protein